MHLEIQGKIEVYKTDPYDPEYYEPTGYGQLTKVNIIMHHKMFRQNFVLK